MNLDMGLVIVALGNVGAVGIVGKYLLQSVEKSNESIPVLLKSVETHSKALEDLFKTRNEHAEEIKELQTIQRLQGCDLPHRRLDDMQVTRRDK